MPVVSRIHQNFLISNYHSVWPIDHDDGSAYYYDSENFLVYGGFKNYLGHSKISQYNVYIYPDASIGYVGKPRKLGRPNLQHRGTGLSSFFNEPYCVNSDGTAKDDSGWGDFWINNKCVIGNPIVYEYYTCRPDDLQDLVTMTANNELFAPNSLVTFVCGQTNWTLQQYQAKGYDIGTLLGDIPTNDIIIQWGRDILGF